MAKHLQLLHAKKLCRTKIPLSIPQLSVSRPSICFELRIDGDQKLFKTSFKVCSVPLAKKTVLSSANDVSFSDWAEVVSHHNLLLFAKISCHCILKIQRPHAMQVISDCTVAFRPCFKFLPHLLLSASF